MTSSRKQMSADELPYLHAIVRAIHDASAVVARDWIGVTQHYVSKEENIADDKVDWKEIVDANLEAISRADVVIVEATSYSFFQGYQLAIALQQKKPTLLLTRDTIKDKAFFGIDHRFMTVKQYVTEDEAYEIASKFIKDNTISSKDLRFNFFIDRQIYNYLRSMSYETGKTKSELIRSLIEREIRNKSE